MKNLIIFILFISFGCEKPKSNHNGKDYKNKFGNIKHDNLEFNNMQDSISISLIEFSLNSKNIEQYFHFEIENRGKIYFFTNYNFYPKSIPKLKLFHKDLIIIKRTESYLENNILELIKYKKIGNIETLVYKYAIEGITITIEVKSVNNYYQIINCSMNEN